MRINRRLIEIVLTLTLALVVVAAYGLDHILSAMISAHFPLVAVAIAFACVATLIAFLRFRMLVRAFGFNVPTEPAFVAFVSGQISNQFLANVLGQSVTRAAMLQRHGVPASVTILLTWIERVVALAVLLALAFIGLAVLLGHVSFDLRGGGAYVIGVAVGIVAALAIGAGVVAYRHSTQIGMCATRAAFVCAAGAAGLTVLVQIMTLGCYLAALAAVGIDSLRLDVAAAIAVVMLVTSLPISFGGWGVREFSAAHALGLVSVPAPAAVAGAVLVGVCFLFTLCALMVATAALRPVAPLRSVPGASSVGHEKWDALILWCAAVLAAGLVFFNIHVPLEAVVVSVNPADIVAVAALMVTALTIMHRRSAESFNSWIWPGMLALTALLAAGLAVGYLRHGWLDWAVINRGVGWLAILGYVVVGIAASQLMGERGRDTVLTAFVAVGCSICLIHILALVIGRFAMPLPKGLFSYPLEGYAGNPNAFALQLMFCLVALFTLTVWREKGSRRSAWALTGLVLLAVLLTHSRTGFALAALTLAAGVAFAPAGMRRRTATAFACSAGIALALFAAIEHTPAKRGKGIAHARDVMVVRPHSDNERVSSVKIGLEMWRQHPIIGGGLGSAVEAAKQETGKALVVHSTPVWVAADFGLVGLAVVGTVIVLWARYAAGIRGPPQAKLTSAAVMSLLLLIIVGGLVHDFAFQRAFWFLLGIFAALPAEAPRRVAEVVSLQATRGGSVRRFRKGGDRPFIEAAE